MSKFKVTGFDSLQRKLRELGDNARALDGEHRIHLPELYPPAFMAKHTDFATIEEMFAASGFTLETPEDFTVVGSGEWDAFVANRTRFADWHSMQESALATWTAHRLGLK